MFSNEVIAKMRRSKQYTMLREKMNSVTLTVLRKRDAIKNIISASQEKIAELKESFA